MEMTVRNTRAKTIIRLQGDFISEPDQDKFRRHIRQLVEQGHKHFVIDLEHVKRMSSCGIGSLVCALTTVRKSGGDLKIVGAGDEVQSILRLTRLDSLFDLHSDVAGLVDQKHAFY